LAQTILNHANSKELQKMAHSCARIQRIDEAKRACHETCASW